jgi:hypothetical protein
VQHFAAWIGRARHLPADRQIIGFIRDRVGLRSYTFPIAHGAPIERTPSATRIALGPATGITRPASTGEQKIPIHAAVNG